MFIPLFAVMGILSIVWLLMAQSKARDALAVILACGVVALCIAMLIEI